MSWSPYDDLDDDGLTSREAAAASRCRCGGADWPGSCPGPANCPCCLDDADDAEDAP